MEKFCQKGYLIGLTSEILSVVNQLRDTLRKKEPPISLETWRDENHTTKRASSAVYQQKISDIP